jgi:hypothetical protein
MQTTNPSCALHLMWRLPQKLRPPQQLRHSQRQLHSPFIPVPIPFTKRLPLPFLLINPGCSIPCYTFLILPRLHSAPTAYHVRSIPRNKHDLYGRKPTTLLVSLTHTLPKRDKAYAAVIPNTSPFPAVVHPLSATALKKVNSATSPSLAFMLVTTYRTAILPTGNRLASAVAKRAVTRRTDESQSANPSPRRR